MRLGVCATGPIISIYVRPFNVKTRNRQRLTIKPRLHASGEVIKARRDEGGQETCDTRGLNLRYSFRQLVLSKPWRVEINTAETVDLQIKEARNRARYHCDQLNAPLLVRTRGEARR